MLERLRSLFRRREGERLSAASGNWWWPWEFAKSASGQVVTCDSSMRVAAVYACVRVIAESVASLPLRVYERLPSGGKTLARGLNLYRLLHDQPNDWQTSFEFREMMQGHLCLRGNAYAQIVMGGMGDPVALLPLHPDRMKVERLVNGRLRYSYTPEGETTPTVYMQDEIFHLRGLAFDGILGISPIRAAAEAIGLTMATEQFGAAFFGRAARPSGVIQVPNKLSEPAYKNLKETWEGYSQRGSHKPAILEQGATWQQLSVNNDESQFLETRKYQISEIARLFRVPPHMIGDLDRATFSNVEQQSIDFVTHCIRPWCVRWEQAILRDLIAEDEKFFAEFLLDGLLRGDAASRSQALQTQFLNGALSIDEWREIENRNPLAEGHGQQHFVPLNIVPVDMAREAASKSAPEPPPKLEDNPQPKLAWQPDRSALSRQSAKVMRIALVQLLKIETSDVLRAAKKTNFLGEIELIYAEHQSRLEAALASPLSLLGLVHGVELSAAHTAATWCAASKDALLAACECQPDELLARVQEAVDRWPARIDEALQPFQEVHYAAA